MNVRNCTFEPIQDAPGAGGHRLDNFHFLIVSNCELDKHDNSVVISSCVVAYRSIHLCSAKFAPLQCIDVKVSCFFSNV